MTMTENKKLAEASLESLYRIFTVPEAPDSTLGLIDQSISRNLAGFLQDHIVASERDLRLIEKDFANPRIPDAPTFVSDQIDFLLDKVVAQSVHIAAPSFVGHMASALPYFMLPLSRIMTALNQNLVKVETSKAFTPLERQVIGMIHHLIYSQDDAFYDHWMHDRNHAIGSFCSGGTIANLTALWAARNAIFAPSDGFAGLAQEGLAGCSTSTTGGLPSSCRSAGTTRWARRQTSWASAAAIWWQWRPMPITRCGRTHWRGAATS